MNVIKTYIIKNLKQVFHIWSCEEFLFMPKSHRNKKNEVRDLRSWYAGNTFSNSYFQEVLEHFSPKGITGGKLFTYFFPKLEIFLV